MATTNQIRTIHSDEFGELAIILIDDKPYFPAVDCAKILGYKDATNAIKQHCKGVVKHHPVTNGGIQQKNYIPEGDLYRLIVRSQLPAAVRFESWLFDDVVPTIRKYGAYVTPHTLDEMLRDPKFAENLMRKLEAEQRKNAELETYAAELQGITVELESRTVELENKANGLQELASEFAPKADFCDNILNTTGLVPVSCVAKDYGMSAAELNQVLHGLGVQHKIHDTWFLYQKYADCGYTQTRTYWINKDKSVLHTCWTEKGRLFLYDFLKHYGILPVLERQSAVA